MLVIPGDSDGVIVGAVVQKNNVFNTQREMVVDKRLYVRPSVSDDTDDDELVWGVSHLFGAVQVLYAKTYPPSA